MRYGLIGERLGHSYSKIIHEMLAEYIYDLIPLTREEFVAFMQKKDFTAINVTIPYKQDVIPYLDELHPLAEEIGAVNTIVNKNGHYIGYNTDFYGFNYMLEHNDIDISGKKCLILGNGGSSLTVQAVLRHLNAGEIYVVSRKAADPGKADTHGKTSNPGKTDNQGNEKADENSAKSGTDAPGYKPAIKTISYENCYFEHAAAQVIVNTTPLGMYPNIDSSPLDLTKFRQCEAVVDIIFNPLQTRLTLQANELGIKGITGLEMLVAQAKQAIEYFLDKKIEDRRIDETYRELLKIIS